MIRWAETAAPLPWSALWAWRARIDRKYLRAECEPLDSAETAFLRRGQRREPVTRDFGRKERRSERAVQGHDQRRHQGLGARLGSVRAAEGSGWCAERGVYRAG